MTLNVTQGTVVEHDFTLLQGGEIDLTVRTPADAVVEGAVVAILDASGNPISESFTLDTMFSTNALRTDAAGRCPWRTANTISSAAW